MNSNEKQFMNLAYKIVVPARFDSTRLPGKALRDIQGKPLIERVWNCAVNAAADEVVVATDDERIKRAVESFGGVVVMTGRDQPSGSDRIAECVDKLKWPDEEIIVNLQGDEPLMPPGCLDQVARLLSEDSETVAASLYQEIEGIEEFQDPNIVKVVTDRNDRAIYFSRSPIPYSREFGSSGPAQPAAARWKRHIGLYAYRAGTLRALTRRPQGPLEKSEQLEQLRILEAGEKIAMAHAIANIPAGVDSEADLERVCRIFVTELQRGGEGQG